MRPALALALLLACKGAPKAPAEQQPAQGEALLSQQQIETLHISMADVAERDVGGELIASGRIAFDDLRVAHVFSPVTGRVTAIKAQLGERVQKGAPLAVLSSPDLASALADVHKAEADLVAAQHELKRQQELFEAHAGAKRDLEIAEDNQLKARAELQRARQKTHLLHSGGPDFVLRSPIAGEVIARSVNPGAEVQAQSTGELFTVGSLDEVWVLADVFEVDLPQVKVGAPVTVSVVAYPDRRFEGRIDWISGALDPATRTARVRCTLRNPGRELKPEMYATASIEVPKTRALAIPRDALLRLNDQTVVFAVLGKNESGMFRFARRVVRVDENVTGDLLPVKSGLSPGDTIVVRGGLILSGMI